MKQILLVGLGGFVGSSLRYSLGLWISKFNEGAFPLSTLSVNLVGSIILGILVGFGIKSDSSSYMLLGIGVCGGFTTFSTFALDGVRLIEQNQFFHLSIYLIGSVILGLLCCLLGFWIGNKFG